MLRDDPVLDHRLGRADRRVERPRPAVTPRRSLARDLARGAAGGVAATVAMSALMLGAQQVTWMGRQPPKRITESALRAVGLRGSNEETRNLASVASHLVFGVGNGALFSVARPRLRLPGPAVLQGVLFALGVYAASYQGWVPA